MTCDLCPAEAVMIAPGQAPLRELFLLDAGTPLRCWCLACWPWLRPEPKDREATA